MYTYVHMYICTYIHVHIYIYIERERCIHTYIYIYMCIVVLFFSRHRLAFFETPARHAPLAGGLTIYYSIASYNTT